MIYLRAINSKNSEMASSTDFKKLFDKYQEEGAPKGVSIVKYCQMNGIIYSQFEKWYKTSRAGVIKPVEVVDKDGLMSLPEEESSSVVSIAHVNLVFSNGLQVNHHNISYQTLRQMIEKLEALC